MSAGTSEAKKTTGGSAWTSRDVSAEADEFLLVRGVVAEYASPWSDDRGVAPGAAAASPQLDIGRQLADDRAQFPLCRFRRPTPWSTPAPAPALRPASRFRRGHGREDRARDRRRPGRCWPRASPRPAYRSRDARRPGREEQAAPARRGAVQPKEGAEDAPYGRGHEVLMAIRASSMPLVTDLSQRGHERSRRKSKGRRTAARRAISCSMPAASYRRSASPSTVMSSADRGSTATAGAAAARRC